MSKCYIEEKSRANESWDKEFWYHIWIDRLFNWIDSMNDKVRRSWSCNLKIECYVNFLYKMKRDDCMMKSYWVKAKNKCKFRILRWDEIVANWEILSLHKNKDEVKEIVEWDECGMKVKVWKKIEEGDVLEFWEMQEVK